jgi:signal transduction histidine kinase
MSGPAVDPPDGPTGPDGRGPRFRHGRDVSEQMSPDPRDARGPRSPMGPMGRMGPTYFHRHGRPWHDRPRERPNWWPSDEPWPPVGEFPWSRVRRLFLIRFAIGVGLVFLLVILGPLILIAQLLTALGLPGPSTGLLAAGVMLFLILGVAGFAGSARRFALPFGDLIEASGRLEAGDYSARVTDIRRGPRELKSLVQAFNAMAARLEDDERRRRTLLADVSHELRTPLAVLQGELEAMIDGVHATDEAHLSIAVEEIRLLTGLVEDLRTLTLAEAGTLALHRETTDLSVLAQEVAASFETLATQSGVAIRVEMPDDMPLAEVDPLRIRQVLGNLMANALRYAPKGTEVSITGEFDAARVRLSVVDHGPGIAPEVLPQLFNRFAKSAESRGSGLGLAIARRLVEAHGGTIRADRPDAGGTAIMCDLPIHPEA